jgi:hypothetical protein
MEFCWAILAPKVGGVAAESADAPGGDSTWKLEASRSDRQSRKDPASLVALASKKCYSQQTRHQEDRKVSSKTMCDVLTFQRFSQGSLRSTAPASKLPPLAPGRWVGAAPSVTYLLVTSLGSFIGNLTSARSCVRPGLSRGPYSLVLRCAMVIRLIKYFDSPP